MKTTCEGNVCSTMPAQAMADVTGTRAHPHKAPDRTLPADLLRSQSNFDVVGATNKYNSVLKNRRLARGLFRGGAGLGMAGAAYGLYEEPELAAGVGTAAALPSLLQHRYNKKFVNEHVRMSDDAALKHIKRNRPTWKDALDTIGHQENSAKALRSNLLRRTAPIAALGGLGAYGAAKGIHHVLDRNVFNKKEKTPE